MPQHEHNADEGRKGEHAEEHPPNSRPDQRRGYAVADPVPIPLPFRGLLHEALNRPDLAERLVGDGGGFGHLILDARGHATEPAAEVHG